MIIKLEVGKKEVNNTIRAAEIVEGVLVEKGEDEFEVVGAGCVRLFICSYFYMNNKK